MKKLFNQLMPYINRKYYSGSPRWMIQDANGRSVSCFCCGNIANAVGEVKLMGWLFRLPVCKAHIRSYFAGRTDVYSFSCPGTFSMNVKYVPESFHSWSMQFLKRIAENAGLTLDDFRQPIAFFRTRGQNVVHVDPLKN